MKEIGKFIDPILKQSLEKQKLRKDIKDDEPTEALTLLDHLVQYTQGTIVESKLDGSTY